MAARGWLSDGLSRDLGGEAAGFLRFDMRGIEDHSNNDLAVKRMAATDEFILERFRKRERQHEMRRVSLHQISYLVLVGADHMLDMGFEPQICKIVKEVPGHRQTLMFTAMWPKEVTNNQENRLEIVGAYAINI